MHGLPKVPKLLRWVLCLGMVTLCLMIGAGTLKAQFLKSLFGRDKPAPAADTSAGDNRIKQKYDSLTRGQQYDRDKLLAAVKPFVEKQFPAITGTVPTIAGAEMVDDDTLCATCHEAYVRYHRTNIHRNQSCEACHGPASEHLKTRGTKPGTILNPKNLKPADQSEICLRCHEKHAKDGFPGQKWRTSTHAHAGNSCVDCHKNHYNIPSGTRPTQIGEAPQQLLPPKAKETAADIKAIRTTFEALGASDPQTCNKCHQQSAAHQVAASL